MKILVIDLVCKAPSRIWGRVMNSNFAGIMSQVVALWCENAGHEVTYQVYTGNSIDEFVDDLPQDVDLAFVCAFSQAGQFSYALSALLRSRGAVTVIGGPHARCYPEDEQRYFDYVLGFTDETLIRDLLADCGPRRPEGVYLEADAQPQELPGVRARWKYVEGLLRRAPLYKVVPMLGSFGCPYTCSFCIDSTVPFRALDLESMQADLRFLMTQLDRPTVGWYDPNFGVRFDETLDAIEAVVPPGRMSFIAESSLSLLSQPHLERLKKNGFIGILPGIESWFDMGNKSKTGSRTGLDKVEQVADHVNLVMSYVPYLQANFVFGLDCDQGPEPFELTKRFIDLAPGAFPAFSLNTCFGRAAPLNLEYQRQGRVLPFPFHFMNNNHVMNVMPKHYHATDFFDHLIDLSHHAFSWRAIRRRFSAVTPAIPKWMNVFRAVTSEGFGRIRNHQNLRQRFETDPDLRRFWNGESRNLPNFYQDWVRRDLGPLWQWLPHGALHHDPNAYLHSETASTPELVSIGEAQPESVAS